jgi:hypothetical protein
MPYTSLDTQIEEIKSEISSSLADSAYTAQDLVYVAKALQALGTLVEPDGVEQLEITSKLFVGANAKAFEQNAALTNAVIIATANEPDYAQIAFKNLSNAANASTDIIVYANNGDDNTGWLSVGVTSNNFSDPDFTITGKNDGYIFYSAPENTTGEGNLVLATDSTGTENKIIFAAGGLSSDATQMEITPDVNVHIEIDTPSTSPSTGALTIVGGVGIQGDVNIAGNITFGGTGTTVETANLSVDSPIIYLGAGNETDAVDLGVVGEYDGGAGTKYVGIVRDATDGIVKFFKEATTKPLTSVNFAEEGLLYADIKVNNIDSVGIIAASAIIGNVSNTELQYLDGVTSAIQTQLNAKLDSTTASTTYAPLASPSLSGTPLAPTASVDTNTTQIATTEYVVGQGYLKSSTAASTYAPLTGASLVRPTLTSAIETNAISATAATGTVNVDVSTSSVYYYTSNASADWTFNFRGNSSTTLNSLLSANQSITVAFLVTNGATPYRPTTFQVDGSTVSPKWQGGTAPTTGNANSIDAYSFTIIKTAEATFTVLAAQTKFA